jgi:hypothetical protein
VSSSRWHMAGSDIAVRSSVPVPRDDDGRGGQSPGQTSPPRSSTLAPTPTEPGAPVRLAEARISVAAVCQGNLELASHYGKQSVNKLMVCSRSSSITYSVILCPMDQSACGVLRTVSSLVFLSSSFRLILSSSSSSFLSIGLIVSKRLSANIRCWHPI